MKIMTVLMALVLSTSVMAGPEEHQSAQTCYFIVKEESSALNDSIPTQICLESLAVDTSAEKIEVYSYFFSDLYKNLKLNYVARKNEDSFSFRASSVLRDDLEKIKLFINGRVDNYGEANLSELEIRVEQVVNKEFVETPYVKNVYKYRTY